MTILQIKKYDGEKYQYFLVSFSKILIQTISYTLILNLIKEVNTLMRKGMSKAYWKVTTAKTDVRKASIFQVSKVCLQVAFWRATTHENIISF